MASRPPHAAKPATGWSSVAPMDHRTLAAGLIDGRVETSDPTPSPDGERVAFVVATVDLDRNETVRRIWLDDRPVTAGPHDGSPVWAPDGRSLAFTSRRGEAERESSLHVLPVDGPGEVRAVCQLPEEIDDLAWAPDGRHLGFTTRVRDERYAAKDVRWQSPRKIERFFTRLDDEGWIVDRPSHVHVVPADGTGRPRDLTPGEHQHHGVAWLPDSSAVVTAAARHDTWDTDLAEDLYLVPLGTGSTSTGSTSTGSTGDGSTGDGIRALTGGGGVYGRPAVSPDGRWVAFVGHDDPLTQPQNAHVGVVSIEGGEHRWLTTAIDRTFGSYTAPQTPRWLDATTLLANAEDRGDTHLYRVPLHGGDPERITHGAATCCGADARAGTIAYVRSTVEHPGEIHVLRDGSDWPITSLTRRGSGWERFAVRCTTPNHAGEHDEIDAWIVRPADFDPSHRYPVLLNVHGGPMTQYGETYFDEAQMQAAAGFVVVMSNPRGGTGRDTAWLQSIMGPKHPVAPGSGWGTVDLDDVLAVLDATLERYDFCDPDRVGMLGGSYGGYMATLLAARHGDRFRAICSERAVNNMLTEEWSSDVGSSFRIEHGPSVVDDPDEYIRLSPARLARDITVPMLVIHAEDDLRCPINQAEELWMTLRLLGRDVTFYRFPGEGHELSRTGSPVHRRMRAEIILDYFAERLAERPGDTGP